MLSVQMTVGSILVTFEIVRNLAVFILLGLSINDKLTKSIFPMEMTKGPLNAPPVPLLTVKRKLTRPKKDKKTPSPMSKQRKTLITSF